MLRVALFSLLVSLPLVSGHRSQEQFSPLLGHANHAKWNLDETPNPNDTDHLVFETVYSLLQHWPNVRMRNGHNIVPGVIPKGTTLYHGTHRNQLPPGPDWVAIDPEYAYYFCWDIWSYRFHNECWYLTLATTRPLKIVYFDGSSSAKFPNGSLDSQELIAWGEARPDHVFEELKRIKDLCEWAQKHDLDGIVRMGMDFEVMLCNFTSGVSTVAFVNLEPPKGVLPMMSGFVAFEAINAGSLHSRLPGETRIQLDLADLVSFYDTQLVPSLIAIRAGQERWDHRVANISSEDLSAVRSKLEATLIRPVRSSSGIDWKSLFQITVDRFAGRFELIRHLLNVPAISSDEILGLANKTQTQLRILLTPYLLLSSAPNDPSDKADVDWTVPIYELCATTHTYTMASVSDSMTYSEKLLLRAIQGTTREICRVVTKMWVAGVYAGLDQSLNTKDALDPAEITVVRNQWVEDLNHLMEWLDWSVWVKCNPGCALEEMCYLPTWPIGFPGFPEPSDRGGRPEGLASSDFRAEIIQPQPDEWIRPRPKCIRRVDPYEF